MGNKNKKSLFTSVLASRESSRGVAGVGTVRHNKLPWEPPGGVLALCGRRRRRPGGWPHVEPWSVCIRRRGWYLWGWSVFAVLMVHTDTLMLICERKKLCLGPGP